MVLHYKEWRVFVVQEINLKLTCIMEKQLKFTEIICYTCIVTTHYREVSVKLGSVAIYMHVHIHACTYECNYSSYMYRGRMCSFILQYYAECQGVIYVVDSSDTENLAISSQTFSMLIKQSL